MGVLDHFSEGALDDLELPQVDLVVPVPTTRSRMVRRGFNPSGALALPLADRLGVPLTNGILVRRRGSSQAAQGRKRREENVRRAYRPGRAIGNISGKRVLLFDDVYTTGATVRSCARILKRNGAQVLVLTLARRVFSQDPDHFLMDDPVRCQDP